MRELVLAPNLASIPHWQRHRRLSLPMDLGGGRAARMMMNLPDSESDLDPLATRTHGGGSQGTGRGLGRPDTPNPIASESRPSPPNATSANGGEGSGRRPRRHSITGFGHAELSTEAALPHPTPQSPITMSSNGWTARGGVSDVLTGRSHATGGAAGLPGSPLVTHRDIGTGSGTATSRLGCGSGSGSGSGRLPPILSRLSSNVLSSEPTGGPASGSCGVASAGLGAGLGAISALLSPVRPGPLWPSDGGTARLGVSSDGAGSDCGSLNKKRFTAGAPRWQSIYGASSESVHSEDKDDDDDDDDEFDPAAFKFTLAPRRSSVAGPPEHRTERATAGSVAA